MINCKMASSSRANKDNLMPQVADAAIYSRVDTSNADSICCILSVMANFMVAKYSFNNRKKIGKVMLYYFVGLFIFLVTVYSSHVSK